MKKKWAVISTWKMSLQGNARAADLLQSGSTAAEAILSGIHCIEDEPSYQSVGYGGLPDRNGRVLTDAGFMDGDTLSYGAVGALEGFRSPADIACSLAKRSANNFLAGPGAAEYAESHGFEKRNNLTPESYAKYLQEKDKREHLKAYQEHDTVCFIGLDSHGTIAVSTSTSGLFLKENGRLGDTPMVGCGFYADSKKGGAACTGFGEEIAKGVLAYRVTQLMADGHSAMDAAQKAVDELTAELTERKGSCEQLCLICMDKNGNFGAGANSPFPFVYTCEGEEPVLYLIEPGRGLRQVRPEDITID